MGAAIFNGLAVKILKNVLRFKNGTEIITGVLNPSVAGYSAQIGSTYIKIDTQHEYFKTGVLDTDWNDKNALQVQGLGEIPSGLVDGNNKVFSTSDLPVPGTLRVIIDGAEVQVSQYVYAYPDITLTTAPGVGQSIEVYYLVTANAVPTNNGLIGFPEIPAGVINGVNTQFTVTRLPLTGTIIVFKDGAEVPSGEWSFVHPIITLNTAPVLGQKIEVYYLTNGLSASLQTNAGNQVVEYVTITGPIIAAKQLTLIATPAVPTRVIMDILSGSGQLYGGDYTVAGNILQWNGLGLDGKFVPGNIVRIQYYTT